MNAIGALALLAERSRLDNLSDAFRNRPEGGGSEQVLTGLVIMAALVAAIWLVSRLLTRDRPRSYNSPRRLFNSLCKAHQLRWGDRSLLRRLARLQRLQDPARLFLESQRFDDKSLGPLRSQSARLRAIRDRLFAAPPAATESAEKPSPAPAPTPEARPSRARRAAEKPQGIPTGKTPLPPPVVVPSLDIPPWSAEAT